MLIMSAIGKVYYGNVILSNVGALPRVDGCVCQPRRASRYLMNRCAMCEFRSASLQLELYYLLLDMSTV